VRIRLSTSLKNSSTDIPQSQMLIERRWWRSNRAHASFMYYSANRRAVASKRFDRLGSRQTFAVTREDLRFNARDFQRKRCTLRCVGTLKSQDYLNSC